MPFIGNALKTNFTKVRLISNTKLNDTSLNKDKTVGVEKNAEWSKIYEFPYIRLAAALNKLKIYQAVFTGVLVGGSTALEHNEILSTGATYMVGALGIICDSLSKK